MSTICVQPELEAGPTPPTVTLMSIQLHCLTEAQCVDRILDDLDHGRGGWVVTPNLDHVRRARHDPAFAKLIAQAELRVADGMPLIWGSRLAGTPLPERVAGSTLVSTLARKAAARGRSIYLLGGAPGAAQGAADALRHRFPTLRIVGTCCPEPGFESDPDELERIKRQLMNAQPDIVYVALGSPKQEHLIARLRADMPATWWLGVGISLSFLCGHVRRAPVWAQRLGLEWIHRLVQEPRRLAKRYLVQGVPFGLLLGAWAVTARFTRRRQPPIIQPSQSKDMNG